MLEEHGISGNCQTAALAFTADLLMRALLESVAALSQHSQLVYSHVYESSLEGHVMPYSQWLWASYSDISVHVFLIIHDKKTHRKKRLP